MASTSAQIAKEKGNAAFKAGDFPAAIGLYASAIVADRKDPTLPLNRAAAYLKLGKYEDAERDCTTVLTLSSSNVKALFRRAQARVGLVKYTEALQDLNEALRLEPSNESVKQEIQKVAGLIEKSQKRAAKSVHGVPTSATPSTSQATRPKRRRIPITIVEPPASPSVALPSESSVGKPPTKATQSTSSGEDFMKPVSSRPLKSTSSSVSTDPQPTPPKASVPKPSTFQEAKQARETAKPSRTGGGIFRSGGSHTLFAPKGPPVQKTAHDNMTKSTPNGTTSKAPMTLFNFIKVWETLRTDEDRWKLVSTFPPASLPSMFQTSLDAGILASLLRTFSSILQQNENARDNIRDYMINLARVPRFGTVLLFMSREEKELARKVWTGLGSGGESGTAAGAWGVKP
ncbi:hypothetical protein PLICRDRAFT_39384 [Plicaturopsis crispa FD-325 SS-3]|nr:hypothetical protein PLICRDRAFT_39384 [Plicaturopsis crispa FD-325 SS-3]